jgi:hypothetical protein
VYWLLHDKQHERFIVGFKTIPANFDNAKVDLAKDYIKKGSVDDFKNKKHVAVATIVGASAASGETVATDINDEGILTLTRPTGSLTTELNVAWLVDTKEEGKSKAS